MEMRWIEDLINLFYPRKCHLCGHDLGSHEKYICRACEETLPRTGYHRTPDNPMEQRFAGQFPFVAATGHFFYSRDSSLSQLIQDMKYRNFPSIGNYMGEVAGKELYSAGFLSEVDLIVPLPMHYLKEIRRGYNQAERIAQGLGKASGIRVAKVLEMTRGRKTQTTMSREERLHNAENLFSPRQGVDLNGKGVLLVDDICTTGATMSGAARAMTDKFRDMRLYLFVLGITF